ncbi:MAG: 50S ribosomal protein L9 [Treponema sp.]|nr:50S ribosomal protein L9 [Treponema sp.]
MKVILNKDLSPLGEEGDVKDVARGYARNYLFPRQIAFPYNERTIKLFESRREEIEKRKADKRQDAAGLKEKLESLSLEVTMPAGPNGKLYGAVSSQTVVDELSKQGYQIERKRIELPGATIKNVGKYRVLIKLYENASAEISISVLGQELRTESRASAPARPPRRRRDEEGSADPESAQESAQEIAANVVASSITLDETPPEAPESESPPEQGEEL